MKTLILLLVVFAFARSGAAKGEDAFPPEPSVCGAQALQSHVGQPLASLPPVEAEFSRRKVCADCMRTMDYVPQRQTVEYDEKTRIILSIDCG